MDDSISRQAIKTKVQSISSKDLNIDFAEPKVIITQSIIRQMIRMVVDIIEKELPSAQLERFNPCTVCQEFDCTGCKFRRT